MKEALLRLRNEEVFKSPRKRSLNVFNGHVRLQPCPPRLGNCSEQNPRPGRCAQPCKRRLQLNWLHPQTKPSTPRGPGRPSIVPSQPPANGPGVTHLMSEALRRGIQGQKGDWALGEEVIPAPVHPLGHYFPSRPWPNELIPSLADPDSPTAPSPGHLGGAAAFKEPGEDRAGPRVLCREGASLEPQRTWRRRQGGGCGVPDPAR